MLPGPVRLHRSPPELVLPLRVPVLRGRGPGLALPQARVQPEQEPVPLLLGPEPVLPLQASKPGPAP